MIKNIISRIITPEDLQKLQEINKDYKSKPTLEQFKETQKVWEQIRQRYIAEHTPEEIKADVAEILEALTVEDFRQSLEEAKADLKDTRKSDITYYMKEYQTRENYINTSDYIYSVVSFFVTSVADHSNKSLLEEIEQSIHNKVLEWYREPTKEEIAEYIKIYSCKADLIPQPLKDIVYPLDRVSKRIFEQKQITSKTSLGIRTGRSDSAGVMVSFMFPEGVTSCNLDNYDKFLYIVVASLYYAGNKQITTNMIFKAMGNTGRPSKDQIERINKSLTRLSFTRIKLSNEAEVANGYKYDLYNVEDEALLNFQRSRLITRGQDVAVINLLNAPVLLRFARNRGQITTFNAALLEDGLNNTDLNVHIKAYLLDYISHTKKNKKLQKKLLFETLCSEFQVGKTRAQRSRLKSKINNLMQFYQKNGFIKSFYFDKANNLYFNL